MRERVNLKSPVRENCTPGSVRGASGNRRPYLDCSLRYAGVSPMLIGSTWETHRHIASIAPYPPAAGPARGGGVGPVEERHLSIFWTGPVGAGSGVTTLSLAGLARTNPSPCQPRRRHPEGATGHCHQVAAGILPAVEGGILPPGPELQCCGTALPPGKTPGSTAGRMPAATAQGGDGDKMRLYPHALVPGSCEGGHPLVTL